MTGQVDTIIDQYKWSKYGQKNKGLVKDVLQKLMSK